MTHHPSSAVSSMRWEFKWLTHGHFTCQWKGRAGSCGPLTSPWLSIPSCFRHPPEFSFPLLSTGNKPEKACKSDNMAGGFASWPRQPYRKISWNTGDSNGFVSHTEGDGFPSPVNVEWNPITFSKSNLLFCLPVHFLSHASMVKIKLREFTGRKIIAIVRLLEEGIDFSLMDGTSIS